MKKGFFLTAWRDVCSSPHWLRTVLILALIGLVPVVGTVIALGIAYGWARDLTWGLRTPLPFRSPKRMIKTLGSLHERGLGIDRNDNIIKRGFRLFTLELVMFGLPFLLGYALDLSLNPGALALIAAPCALVGVSPQMMLNVFIAALCYVLILLVIPFILVGWMRISIYGRISAGFQMERVWPMVRYRTSSLMRISGMVLVVFFSQLVMVLLAAAGAGLTMMMQYALTNFAGNPFDLAVAVAGLRPLAAPILIAVLYAISVLHTLGTLIIARAMGYWTAQFDVPHWLGQDDPMPFERHGVADKAHVPPRGDGLIPD